MHAFWKAQIANGQARPLTIHDLQRGIEAIKIKAGEERVHLIRGQDWCDLCGPRQFWTHGHPLDGGK